MTRCLFCQAVLDGITKPEHVLLKALGGRMTTKKAICSAHNNIFGGTIDDELTSQVMALRNLLQLESGTGRAAPTLRNVQAGEYVINIKGDGTLEGVAKPFTIEDLPDGAFNVHIQARSEEHLAELIPHIAKAIRKPEEEVRALIAAAEGTVVSQRPGVVQHKFAFGGPGPIRSMVKAALVLWSTRVGNDEVRGGRYAAARNFVVKGDADFNFNRTHLDSRFFVEVERMKARYGPIFNLIYVRSDDTGRVIGHFTLYNLVAWQLTLAEAGGVPNTKIALISNPLKPGDWTGKAAEQFDVPFVWLDSPDYTDEMVRSKQRLDAALRYYFETNAPKENARLIEEALQELGIKPGDPIPRERASEISALIADKVTCHYMGLPYERRLSPERMEELTKGKK